MARVVFILGLCGSGKSTRACKLAAAGFANFDEKATGRSLHPDWPSSAYADFLEAVASDKDCVATEVYFFQPDAQERVTRDLTQARPDVVIEWECFDPGDLQLANHNCHHDASRTPEGIEGNLIQNDFIVRCLKIGTMRLPPRTRLLRTVRL